MVIVVLIGADASYLSIYDNSSNLNGFNFEYGYIGYHGFDYWNYNPELDNHFQCNGI